ncbi:hypothetical protein CB1_000632073 [Camelus ferus]|nr:hypothetical protein CB1_000632073 [Camelus ferus]
MLKSKFFNITSKAPNALPQPSALLSSVTCVQTRLYVRVNFIAVCLVADKPGHSLMATVTVWTKPAALRRTCHGGRHTHDMAEVRGSSPGLSQDPGVNQLCGPAHLPTASPSSPEQPSSPHFSSLPPLEFVGDQLPCTGIFAHVPNWISTSPVSENPAPSQMDGSLLMNNKGITATGLLGSTSAPLHGAGSPRGAPRLTRACLQTTQAHARGSRNRKVKARQRNRMDPILKRPTTSQRMYFGDDCADQNKTLVGCWSILSEASVKAPVEVSPCHLRQPDTSRAKDDRKLIVDHATEEQTPELLIHTARPAPRCGAFFLSPASRTSILACSLQPGDERLVLKSVRVEPVIIQTQANRLPLGRTALLVNQASGKWVVYVLGQCAGPSQPLCVLDQAIQHRHTVALALCLRSTNTTQDKSHRQYKADSPVLRIQGRV